MPMIRPSSDLRNNYNEISTLCHETQKPIYITKNGAGDLAVMSIELYELLTEKYDNESYLEKSIKPVKRQESIEEQKESDKLEEKYKTEQEYTTDEKLTQVEKNGHMEIVQTQKQDAENKTNKDINIEKEENREIEKKGTIEQIDTTNNIDIGIQIKKASYPKIEGINKLENKKNSNANTIFKGTEINGKKSIEKNVTYTKYDTTKNTENRIANKEEVISDIDDLFTEIETDINFEKKEKTYVAETIAKEPPKSNGVNKSIEKNEPYLAYGIFEDIDKIKKGIKI